MALVFDVKNARDVLFSDGVSEKVGRTLEGAIQEIERLRVRDAAMQAQIVEQAKRIEDLETALIRDRTEKLAMAFAEYEPPLSIEACEKMAREQLQEEGLV